MRYVILRATPAVRSVGSRVTSYTSPASRPVSERRVKPSFRASAKNLFSAGRSKDTPTMSAPASVNSGIRSRNPSPSCVHPEVLALGYHQSTTHRPRKSAREPGRPSWSGRVNAGAVLPGASIRTYATKARLGKERGKMSRMLASGGLNHPDGRPTETRGPQKGAKLGELRRLLRQMPDQAGVRRREEGSAQRPVGRPGHLPGVRHEDHAHARQVRVTGKAPHRAGSRPSPGHPAPAAGAATRAAR